MCGIVGCISNGPVLTTERAIAVRDSLTHRGPDDAGLFMSNAGSVVLGSRRLAILDLSPSGHQPMQDRSGNLTVVFNGEIYNYVELREELTKNGYRFRSNTDTEVLLASYSVWGTDCLPRLNGMFAFAIWDEQHRRLFAARDRFGEKPFYYYHRPERALFLFASEIKALLASGLFEARPDNHTIYRFLNSEVEDGADTMFQDILMLLPAHALLYSAGESTYRTWRYWDLDPEARIELKNDDAYSQRFLELLRESVRIRLRSDVRVGSSLSGGLDSSTVVSLMARQLNNHHLTTFSARFHDLKFDEGPYMRCAIDCTRADAHFVYPNPRDLPKELEVLTWHQDNPASGTSLYAQWNVMRLAKKVGVTVLLDGQGADEMLGGYHYYFGAHYKSLLRHFQWLTFLASTYSHLRQQGPTRAFTNTFTFFPSSLRPRLRRLVRPLGIRHEFSQRWGAEQTSIPSKFKDPLQEELYQTLTRTSLPALLRYADRNSMAFSREVRLPFLDHRLVEFLFAVPEDQKMRGVQTKVILRNAIRGLVPEKIRMRKDKLGFAPPQSSWLRGPHRSWVEEVFHSWSFRNRDWIEPEVVDRVWSGFLLGRISCDSLLWRWLSLEYWARVFLDQQVGYLKKTTSHVIAAH